MFLNQMILALIWIFLWNDCHLHSIPKGPSYPVPGNFPVLQLSGGYTAREVWERVFLCLVKNCHTPPMLCKMKWLLQIGLCSSSNVLDVTQLSSFSLVIIGLMFWGKILKKTAELAATSKINLVTIKIIFNRVSIYKLLFFGWLHTDVDLKEEVRDFHLLLIILCWLQIIEIEGMWNKV